MANGDRPISAVLNDIVGNVQDIVRSELRLARTELTTEATKAGSAAALIAVGVLLLAFSAGFVLLLFLLLFARFFYLQVSQREHYHTLA